MSHEDSNSGVILSGGKVFDPTSHEVLADTPPSVSPSFENPKKPEIFEKTIYQRHDDFLVRSWLNQKSPNTKRCYSRIAQDFFTLIHPRSLKDANLHDVENFIEARVGFKKSTIALRIAALKSLLTHAHRTGYLNANLGAFIKGVKADSKLTERYLTEEEVVRMIALSKNPRDQAILKLLYNGGLRVSELVAINWGEVSEREQGQAQIKILGKGNKERVVMITEGAFDAIKSLKQENTKPKNAVFASDYGNKTRLTDRTVREIVFKAALRAGIKKRVSPHWLRHAHASHALDRGAPIHLVQSTLGHASVATTGRYLHSRPEESSGKYLAG